MVRTAGIMKIQKPGSLNTLVCPSVGRRHCPISIVRRPLTAERLVPKDSFHLHVDRTPMSLPFKPSYMSPESNWVRTHLPPQIPFLFERHVITLKYPVIIRHYCLHILQASRVPLSTISPPQRVACASFIHPAIR